MKVAFFGAFDPGYPRTRVFEEGLAHRGSAPLRICVPPRCPAGLREARLLGTWALRARGLRALLVPAFGHRDVPLAKLLGRASGVPVLFDPLVSRWDTQVMDLGRVRRGSLSERRLAASDRVSLSLADLVICDTWEHGDFYSTRYGVSRKKLCRIPVGADTAAFDLGGRRADAPRPGPFEVIYVGGYLPLHGLPAILDAATALEERHGARLVRWTLVGSGMLKPFVEREVAARGLRSVRLVPRLPYRDALERMRSSDVALGIFGTTEKAGRVVPHKVYQAMALGVPVLTRRSAAIAEYFREGEHLLAVPAGDGGAIAAGIERLASDPELRQRVGAAGRAAARSQASPERIGALLLEAIQQTLEATAPRLHRG